MSSVFVYSCISQGADGVRGLKGSKGEKVTEQDNELLLFCLLSFACCDLSL